MAEPLVSVIVTTYNREEYLKETLKSILAQTFTDFELIVVDNFSNYDFFRVIGELNDSRIKPYQNTNYGIIAVNRNFGISKASGKYLAFCDDDDLWEPDKLESQINYANNVDLCIIGSSLKLIDENGGLIKVLLYKQYKDVYDLYKGNKITLSSVLINSNNRDLIRFEESPLFVGVEDWALWLKLIHSGYNIHIIEAPLVLYRWSGQNFSRNKGVRPIKQIAVLSQEVLRSGYFCKRKYMHAILNNLFYFFYYQRIKRHEK